MGLEIDSSLAEVDESPAQPTTYLLQYVGNEAMKEILTKRRIHHRQSVHNFASLWVLSRNPKKIALWENKAIEFRGEADAVEQLREIVGPGYKIVAHVKSEYEWRETWIAVMDRDWVDAQKVHRPSGKLLLEQVKAVVERVYSEPCDARNEYAHRVLSLSASFPGIWKRMKQENKAWAAINKDYYVHASNLPIRKEDVKKALTSEGTISYWPGNAKKEARRQNLSDFRTTKCLESQNWTNLGDFPTYFMNAVGFCSAISAFETETTYGPGHYYSRQQFKKHTISWPGVFIAVRAVARSKKSMYNLRTSALVHKGEETPWWPDFIIACLKQAPWWRRNLKRNSYTRYVLYCLRLEFKHLTPVLRARIRACKTKSAAL